MKDIPRIDSKSEKTIRKLRRELGTKPSIINEIKQVRNYQTQLISNRPFLLKSIVTKF